MNINVGSLRSIFKEQPLLLLHGWHWRPKTELTRWAWLVHHREDGEGYGLHNWWGESGWCADSSETFMRRNWSAHGQNLKVMNEMFTVWIETYERVVENALYLDELLVNVVIVDWNFQGFLRGWVRAWGHVRFVLQAVGGLLVGYRED